MKKQVFLLVSYVFILGGNVSAQFSENKFEGWTDEQYRSYEDSIMNILYPQPISVSTSGGLAKNSDLSDNPTLSADVPILKANNTLPVSATVDKSKVVGEIAITSGTTSIGARTYTVPIEIFPGMNGHQPSLSLNYNSQSGSSILGTGWMLGGQSMITRGSRSLYYDNDVSGVELKNDDALFLDGMRLIKYASDAAEMYYETEQGNIKVKCHCSGDVIKYFEVFYPDGNKGIYGYQSNDCNRVTYPVTSLSDLFNNTISYAYDFSNNFYYIKKISYNNASVDFYYDSRTDLNIVYSGGIKTVLNKRLSRINCSVNNNATGEYRLSYNTYKNGVSLLSEIHYISGGKSYNPIRLYYGEDSSLKYYASSSTNLKTYYEFDKPWSVRIVRGRIDYGKEADGIAVLPNKTSYWQHYRHATDFRHSQHRFDNQYDGSEKIYVYPSVQSTEARVLDNITVGAGFIDMFTVDLFGDGQECLVKVNNYVEINTRPTAELDKVVFTIYRPVSGSSGSLQLYKTCTFNFKTVITDRDGGKSVHPKFYYPGDFDGDGKMEIMAVSVDSPLGDIARISKCYIFDLNNNKVCYESNLFKFTHVFTGTRQTDAQEAVNNSDKVFVFDCDGDGKTDVCHIDGAGAHFYTFKKTDGMFSARKVGVYAEINRSRLKNRELMVGDVNGDGLGDLMVSPSSSIGGGYWTMHRSYGNCNFDIEETRIVKNDDSGYTGFIIQDVNGDGKCDLVNYRSARFDTYLSSGSGITSVAIPETYAETNGVLVPVDINSWGSHIQLLFLKNGVLTKYAYVKSGHKDYLLTSMINSLGAIEHNYYERIGEQHGTHIKGSDAIFPYVNINDGLEVLASSSLYLDGVRQTNDTYYYNNAVFHRQGRGFVGFGTVKRYTERGLCYANEYDPYNYGVLKIATTPQSEVTSVYSVNIASDKTMDVLLTSKTEKDLLKDNTVNTVYTYDSYGYPTEETITFADGTTISVKNSYSSIPDVADGYNLGFLTDMTKTITAGSETYTERMRIPASSRRLPSVRLDYKNGNQVKNTVYAYDACGNVVKESVTRYSGTRGENTLYEYDSYGRVTKKTDRMGFSEMYAYDNMGNISTVTDYRGGVTNLGYDAMRREIRRQFPDSTVMTKAYEWSGSDDTGLYSITTTMTGKPEEKAFYDTFNREVRSGKLVTVDVIRDVYGYVWVDKIYDVYGNLKKESLPYLFSDPVLWNEYAYDKNNRVTSVTEATGRVTTYGYSGLKVTETVNGVKKEKTYDVMGRLSRIDGDAGVIAHIYAPDGQLKMTGSVGGAIQYTYDRYRRKFTENDPAHGLTRYEYDNYGNIVRKTDANQNVTTYKYDALHRITDITAPDFKAVYSYSAKNDLVAVVVGDNIIKRYAYDRYGRIIQSIESLGGGISERKLRKDYTYSDGNIHSIQYSNKSGKIVTEIHRYTRGWLSDVRIDNEYENDTVVYKISRVNEFNKPVEVISGKGMIRNYSYDEYGFPSKRQIGIIANNPSLLKVVSADYRKPLDESYKFNYFTHNLESTIDGVNDWKWEYAYDKLDRLTGAYMSSMSYDGKGNITRRSEVGAFKYGINNNPCAMARADFYGNYMSSPQLEIKYTSFSRPSQITGSGYTASFLYDENYKRVRMIITHGDKGYLTRYYFGDCYEMDVKNGVEKEKLYIGGDYYTAPAVLIRKSNSDEWRRYDIVRDRLGSVISVVDADRQVKVGSFSEAGYLQTPVGFDAWGRLRDPSTRMPYTLNEDWEGALGRGFTGHEHLPMFGLINMNARLYDPLLGRFLSPDPYIQETESPQNYNRYSYCLNNPLRYTDRTGELFWVDDFLIGFIKGVILDVEKPVNYALNQASNAIKIWGGLFVSDKNKSFMGKYWELLSRFTWQAPQTLLGFTVAQTYNTFGNVEEVKSKFGATVIKTNSIGNAVTIGNYIMGNLSLSADPNNSIFQHEYGHYLQSQTIGPLYLYWVGLPSLISASTHDNHRYKKYERDASLRAFLYFNKYVEGFYELKTGWDFKSNPLLRNDNNVDYNEIKDNHGFYHFGMSPL